MKIRRWRLVTRDTWREVRLAVNETLVFAVRQVKVLALFSVILLTSLALNWLSQTLVAIDQKLWLMARVLDALGWFGFAVDALWLSNVMCPWVPAVKRWMSG
jgi:hypothetical protein